jgi:hypothetical protein
MSQDRCALLEVALREAREFVRTSKFKFESFGDHTTSGEINQWIYERDAALRQIDKALEQAGGA